MTYARSFAELLGWLVLAYAAVVLFVNCVAEPVYYWYCVGRHPPLVGSRWDYLELRTKHLAAREACSLDEVVDTGNRMNYYWRELNKYQRAELIRDHLNPEAL